MYGSIYILNNKTSLLQLFKSLPNLFVFYKYLLNTSHTCIKRIQTLPRTGR